MNELLDMNNEALFAIFAATAGPYAIAVINREAWPSLMKKAVQYVVCALLAVGWLVATDKLDLDNWFRLALVIAVGSTFWFRVNTTAIKAVESATG